VPGFRDARPFDAWLDLSDTDRSRIFDALVEGLRRLAFEDAHLDGVELILSDLFPPLLRLGVPANLPRELGDSPAGGVLDAMRAHDRERTVRRNRATAVQDATAIAKERGDLRRPQNRNY
jgi:hypothetical protein